MVTLLYVHVVVDIVQFAGECYRKEPICMLDDILRRVDEEREFLGLVKT